MLWYFLLGCLVGALVALCIGFVLSYFWPDTDFDYEDDELEYEAKQTRQGAPGDYRYGKGL